MYTAPWFGLDNVTVLATECKHFTLLAYSANNFFHFITKSEVQATVGTPSN